VEARGRVSEVAWRPGSEVKWRLVGVSTLGQVRGRDVAS
jgi:hypothetical protein